MNMQVLSLQSAHDPSTSAPHSRQITMSVDETMAALSIGRTMVYELIRSHAIRTIKIGKKRLVIVASIHEYISDLESYGIGELGGE
jgi:excisionase family DNA binding protein